MRMESQELYLIEPRGACVGGKVQPDVLVFIEPRHDAGMRVGRQIIDDRVQLSLLISPIELLQKTQNLRMRVAFRHHSLHRALMHLQSGKASSPPRCACIRPRAA